MATKICTKCKIEKDISCFHKHKHTKDGFQCWCVACKNQYHKNNTPRIVKQRKQYRENNSEKIAKQKKQWYENNKSRLLKKAEQRRKNNILQITKWKKQYHVDNAPRIIKKTKQHKQASALFETYFKELETFEEIRRCSKKPELLEVKCAYCGKWLIPTNRQVSHRIGVFNGIERGELRFYCSENCKQSCPIYGQTKYPKGFKKATSREVVPLLRQLVLERDNYTCQKCGATSETAQLHVHHEKSYTLNKIMANDPDNCMTLCKECHKEIHSQKGCRYNDLKC